MSGVKVSLRDKNSPYWETEYYGLTLKQWLEVFNAGLETDEDNLNLIFESPLRITAIKMPCKYGETVYIKYGEPLYDGVANFSRVTGSFIAYPNVKFDENKAYNKLNEIKEQAHRHQLAAEKHKLKLKKRRMWLLFAVSVVWWAIIMTEIIVVNVCYHLSSLHSMIIFLLGSFFYGIMVSMITSQIHE
jgi:hypothetical protein